MTFRLITTLTPAPRGFTQVALSRKELMAGPVALLCGDIDRELKPYSEYLPRCTGIFMMLGATLEISELGECLWRAQVPAAYLEDLADWLSPLLVTLLQRVQAEDRLTLMQRSLDRHERSLRETTLDYQRVNQRLLNKVKDLTSAQEEIIELNHVLESRVVERTADLEASLHKVNQAQEQLIQAEKLAALGSMVAGLAHEINTPLGNCVLAASNLEDTVNELLESVTSGVIKRQEFLDGMEQLRSGFELLSSNLGRSADLVGRFKQVAADQSNEERRPFTFSEMLEDTVAAMSPRLKRARCAVDIHCADNIELDSYPGDFSQILMNLIMNSLSHGFQGQSGGQINITVSVSGSELLLDYRDSGVGLSDEAMERLFEPFYTTNREHGGTGLGMPIVHNLISQRLGGSIRLQSGIGAGIHFLIQTPLIAP